MKYSGEKSVIHGIKKLDTDPDFMFCFVPLQVDHNLKNFIDTIREKNLKRIFNGDWGENDIAEYYDIIPEEISPFSFEESRKSLKYKERGIATELDRPYSSTLSKKVLFQTKSGDNIAIAGHRPLTVDLIVVQTDFNKAITPENHKDGGEFVINLYAAGSGIHYMADENASPIIIKSPVVTMHRGTEHKFGVEGAVWHRGQHQKDECVSVASLLSSTPT